MEISSPGRRQRRPRRGLIAAVLLSSAAALSLVSGARAVEAMAGGATLSADVVVATRVRADDSFRLELSTPEGTVIGAADTGSSNAAATGDTVVLPRTDGASFTLTEKGGTGTNLAAYDITWFCTSDLDDSALTATGASIQVSPDAGEAITCTVRNAAIGIPTTTAPPGQTTTTIPGEATLPAAGELARTGASQDLPLALVGFALVALGLVITGWSQRLRHAER